MTQRRQKLWMSKIVVMYSLRLMLKIRIEKKLIAITDAKIEKLHSTIDYFSTSKHLELSMI